MGEWLGIPAAFIAWGFALYVYFVAPPSRGARWLVAMLVVDGAAVFTSGSNHLYVSPVLESLGLPTMQPVWHQASDWALVAVYLPFLGITLKSPLVAPLKSTLARRAILVGGLGFAVLLFFMPAEVANRFNTPFYLVICLALAWGFAAAVHSWYIATNEAERARARAFTFAFGIRDTLWMLTFGAWTLAYYELAGLDITSLSSANESNGYILSLMYQLAVIIYVPLVAYGVLRVQLFDIDLRIKRTLKRGTIAAAFVATFFVISELAGNYLSSQLGGLLGIVATGVLMFFLDPMQRAAERLSDRVMPNTVDTQAYAMFRKLQVYDAALKAALEDGHISEKQRRVLDSMVESMGIDRKDAAQIERDAIAL